MRPRSLRPVPPLTKIPACPFFLCRWNTRALGNTQALSTLCLCSARCRSLPASPLPPMPLAQQLLSLFYS
eukprot:3836591-Pleurochrysis_carterae.AAC.1